MDESIGIFRLFCRSIQRELTINQIAKATKKSYSFTNRIVKELIHKDLLAAKTIGHAILCKAQYKNNIARQYLALASALEAYQELQQFSVEKQKRIATILALVQQHLLTAVLIQGQLYIIQHDDTTIKGEFQVISRVHFKEFVRQHHIDQMAIIAGYETFWRLVGEDFE